MLSIHCRRHYHQKTYWCGSSTTAFDSDVEMGQEDGDVDPEYFEAKPVDLKAGIMIRNLTKVRTCIQLVPHPAKFL